MNSIAFATSKQVANATVAHATVCPMNHNELQEWRAKRLSELAKRMGGNTALGKRLGYKNGAFVGQMIKGIRPITEKTVLAIEAWPGCSNWFSQHQQEVRPAETTIGLITAQDRAKTYVINHAWPFSNLTKTQWDALDASEKSMVEGMALGFFMSKRTLEPEHTKRAG